MLNLFIFPHYSVGSQFIWYISRRLFYALLYSEAMVVVTVLEWAWNNRANRLLDLSNLMHWKEISNEVLLCL